mmetsp:Transcript_34654/g.72669  ORF Transcript_34654/g.72669 Transcript_34654/m.72669 type:complete len:769 (-) Transcript_34654:316-2622(-)
MSGEQSELAIQVIGCMVEVLADDDGNIDQKCFEKIFIACIKAVIVGMKVGDQALVILQQALGQVGWQPTESFQKDFKDGLLDKIKNAFPLVSKGLFRFFDADGSGFISKDEVMVVVNAFIQLADPAYQNLPMRDRLKGIVEGLFRVFDTNGNGIIESFELNEIVSDVISGIANILTTLIDYLEPHFLKEPLDGLARIYADKLLEQTGEEPFPTAKIVAFSLSAVPDSPEAFPDDETLAAQRAQAEAAVGGLDGKLAAVAAQYAAFLAKFDAQAEDGRLAKAKCVGLATEGILEIFESNFSPDDVKRMADAPLSTLSAGLAGAGASLDEDLSSQILASIAAAVRAFIKGGGLKRLLEAVFDCLDVNNDDYLTRLELTSLLDACAAAFNHGPKVGLKDKLGDLVRAALALIDADADGTLTRDEIRAYAAKAIKLSLAVVKLGVNAVKQVLCAAGLPLLTAGLSVKAQMIGGGPSLSLDDINSMISRAFPPPPPRIPVGTVVRLADGIYSEGSLKEGELAMLITDDGTGNPYKVRTADGFDGDSWILLTSLVPADEAAAAEWLKTAKPGPTRYPVGTVVRLADGVESDGPLKAGQLAVIITEDGSSNPYRVRTADGVEHSNWFVLRALVEAEGGMAAFEAEEAELKKSQLGEMVQSSYWDSQGEERLLLDVPLEAPLSAVRLSFSWSDQGAGEQKGRVWLRLVRDGELVSSWGEAAEEGVGFAPHYESEVDIVAPLADARAGDRLQVFCYAGKGGGYTLTVNRLRLRIPEA